MNTTISNSTIDVEEGQQPARITCSSKAYPEPTYEWRRNDKFFAKGSVLHITHNVTRAENGADFECIASNKYGQNAAKSDLNVMCKFFGFESRSLFYMVNIVLILTDKPNCTLMRKELNEDDTLICMSLGNPTAVSSKTKSIAYKVTNIRALNIIIWGL